VSPLAARAAPRPHARALGALALAGLFVFGLVIALVGALVPSLSSRLALTLGDVGSLFLAMNFAMLVASITIGLVVDRYGLKPPIATGAALVAAGLLLVAAATTTPVLFLAVVCLGFGGGLVNGASNTLAADLHDDPERKAAALNMLGVFYGFGALMLPFSVGALTAHLGFAGPLVVASVLCLAVGGAAAVQPFPPPKQRIGLPLSTMPRLLREPVVLALGALLFFQSGNEFALGGYITSFLTRDMQLAADTAAYVLAGYWAALMAGRLLLTRVLLLVGAPAVVFGSAALSVVAALGLAAAPTPALAIAGSVFMGLALAGTFPTVLGITGAAFERHSGTVFGVLFTMALSGGMVVPWVAGHLAEAAGVRAVFVLAAVNFVGVALLVLAARRALATRAQGARRG
jgi:MFS transporter, FHS family, glucose/mannose:H+ symporter